MTQRKSRLRFRWWWLLVAALVILAGLSYAWHWDDRGVLWLRERNVRSRPGAKPEMASNTSSRVGFLLSGLPISTTISAS